MATPEICISRRYQWASLLTLLFFSFTSFGLLQPSGAHLDSRFFMSRSDSPEVTISGRVSDSAWDHQSPSSGLGGETVDGVEGKSERGRDEDRNAYATMMYCGTARDYEFYIATRVLFKGLLKMQPKADLVVLVSAACPQKWLDEYASDGFRVVVVDNIPNPYKDQAKFERRFLSSLNKLYAWTLTDYKRVVMLDADNIFFQNADELFQCGQFCAVFIDPCMFHTGLFVLEPSNETFSKMVNEIGRMSSRDGGDQGFLLSYFSDLLNQPLFIPPANGSALTGRYRLPFGYQMDTSYYYWRMKWRVPCGPNTVMTFPGMPALKPWFWYSWPLLPLGLTWHEERRTSIGYEREMPILISEVVFYVILLLIAISMRYRFSPSERASTLKLCISRFPDSLPYPFCHPWAIKGATTAYITLSILLPFVLVPGIVHSLMGWAIYFLGSLAMLSLLGSVLHLPWTAVLTPWLALILAWINLAAPIYSHGLPRTFGMAALAFLLSPFLWWSFKEIMAAVDSLIEREPLMARFCTRYR